MSINMQSSLDALKRQALFTIIGNMSISQLYIKEQINNYINTGDSSFSSLLGKLNYDQRIISSSQVNSIYLLAYLDFFALYTILYANYPLFENLKNVSEQKYLYIDSLYKDLIVIINEKQLQIDNLNVFYTNFLFPKNIDLSESNSRENNSPDTLNTEILTLPIKTKKKIYPRSIMVADDDKSIHNLENNTTLEFIDYSIERSQNHVIGVVEKIYAGNNTTSYSKPPVISGTVYGFFSNRIFIQCVDVVKDINDSITSISLISSSNGQSWSKEYVVIPAVASDILIEGDIKIGLTITLFDIDPIANYTLGLTKNDLWNIDIKGITIPDPKIKATVKFESLDSASYISFSDASIYSLNNFDLTYKKKKYSESMNINDSLIYLGISNNIIPIFDQVSELSITAEQNDYYIKQSGSSLVYSFDFNIKDIHLVSNEYKQQGSLTFNAKKVDRISTISIDPKEYILNRHLFIEEDTVVKAKQKSFIEYNIMLKNNSDEVVLPILPKNSGSLIYEYIIPEKVDSNIAYFKTRFPANTTPGAFNTYEIGTGNPAASSYSNGTFTLNDYNPQYSYAIYYEIIYSTFDDLEDTGLWTHKANQLLPIYYTYYKDTDSKNYIMVRQDNGNKLFSGEIKSFIEMRSLELPYITPIIYEYPILSS